MKQVEFYAFLLPPDDWNKKPHLSRWKMTLEDASEYPGATPDLSTMELRNCPESPEEYQHLQARGPKE